MADDPNPALRAELNAAFDIVDPQVSGLQGLLTIDGLSEASQNTLTEQLETRTHRKGLVSAARSSLDTVVSTLNALKADGYPAPPPPSDAPTDILEEVQEKERDIIVAAHVFGSTTGIQIGTQAQVDEILAGVEANKKALEDAME